MKRQQCFVLIFGCCLMAFLLAACAFPGLFEEKTQSPGYQAEQMAKTFLVQTGMAYHADGETSDMQTQTPSVTSTRTPHLESASSKTPEPPLNVLRVTVSVETNCRQGPGEVYAVVGDLSEGETAPVLAQSEDGLYWVIDNPDGEGSCWLWGYHAALNGPSADLARVTPEALPSPKMSWEGLWTIYMGKIGGPLDQASMAVTVKDYNLSAVVTLGGQTLTLSGEIKDDGSTVVGQFSGDGMTGSFSFYGLTQDQFQGQGIIEDRVFAWCGITDGTEQPTPCFK